MAMTEKKLRRQFSRLLPPKKRKATEKEIEGARARCEEMRKEEEARKAAQAPILARIERLERHFKERQQQDGEGNFHA